MRTPITDLFGIRYPIIQGGMVWNSGWRLAAAVSQAGGLGLIGAGSMYPEVLRAHIRKARAATLAPLGVNVPLLYPQVSELMNIIVDEGIRVVFTSAGNPATWTGWLRERGCTVVHVVANARFAQKAEAAGCDAVVAEGVEAGGHNGREETTTLVLVPLVRRAVPIPVIAAGGIATGAAIAAALALGADGVQIGSRFAATLEGSGHPDWKQAIVAAQEGDTRLSLKAHVPVRLLRNDFRADVEALEARGASRDELVELLGRGRAKRGMFEGDLAQGELEIGQCSALIDDLPPVAVLMPRLLAEYRAARARLADLG
jgi:enoyl-[acyl-carrier protein] reductase II